MRYTEEQLKSMDRELLIQLFLGLQEELHGMDRKLQLIMEQQVLSNKARFGRSSEKMPADGQISFMEVNGEIVFFNEAEAHADPEEPEPEIKPAHPRGSKRRDKRADDMKDLKVNRIDHYMTDEELTDRFGENGWKQLPDVSIA